MKYTLSAVLATAFTAALPGVQAFSASASNNVVYYWGQNSAGGFGTQASLASYCQSNDADIMVLSFLDQFYSTGGYPSIEFGGTACSTGNDLAGTALLQCPDIAADIAVCQGLGKKVLLSLGGAAGSYGFSSDSQAETFATELWNLFGGGTSSVGRPFGTSVIDGFDLDIEGGGPTGYAAFATKMRQYYNSDSSKDYYLSAAPQCPYPDAEIGNALANAEFDFIFIQFYNNYCGIQNWVSSDSFSFFNYDTWDTFLKSSPSPNAKLFLGVPGSATAAGSGYRPASTVAEISNYLQETYSSFGGVMVWDASQAWANTVDGATFADTVKRALDSGDSAPAPPPPSAPITTSSPAVSTPAVETTSTTSVTLVETSTSVLQTFTTTSNPTSSPAVTSTTIEAVASTPATSETASETTFSETSSLTEATSSAPNSINSVYTTETSSAVETTSDTPPPQSTESAVETSQTTSSSAGQTTEVDQLSTTTSNAAEPSSSSVAPNNALTTSLGPVSTTTAAEDVVPTSTITLTSSITGTPTEVLAPSRTTSWGQYGPVVIIFETVWVTATVTRPNEIVTLYQTNQNYAEVTEIAYQRGRRDKLSGPFQTTLQVKSV